MGAEKFLLRNIARRKTEFIPHKNGDEKADLGPSPRSS